MPFLVSCLWSADGLVDHGFMSVSPVRSALQVVEEYERFSCPIFEVRSDSKSCVEGERFRKSLIRVPVHSNADFVFFLQDLQIERERSSYNISGGCTALIVVCLLGKLYVANAGDSR